MEVRERLDIVKPVMLRPSDQQWMASFGFEPDLSDPTILASLNELVILGSSRLEKVDDERLITEVTDARKHFFTLLGLQEIVEKFHRPTAIPLDTFVGTQRVFTTLGLNSVRVIHAHPPMLGYSPESVREKVENIKTLGLDPIKVINANPPVFSSATDSVREKMENIKALGLDPIKVIHAHPAVLNLGLEYVRKKVRFIERSVRLLGWEHSASELIELYPPMLGFSSKKLKILRRIAATSINEKGRSTEPKRVKSDMILPLENFVIASNGVGSYDEVTKAAKKVRLSSADRKQKALGRAQSGELGQTGTRYLEYRGL